MNKLDHALIEAMNAWRAVIVTDTGTSEDAMRAALLAALPVLLGPVVEELQRESDVCSEIGDMISAGKSVTYWACAERIEAIYAPSLGEGHE